MKRYGLIALSMRVDKRIIMNDTIKKKKIDVEGNVFDEGLITELKNLIDRLQSDNV